MGKITIPKREKVICPYCGKEYFNRDFLARHIAKTHIDVHRWFDDSELIDGNVIWECINCNRILPKPTLRFELGHPKKNSFQLTPIKEVVKHPEYFCSKSCLQRFSKTIENNTH